MLSLEFLEFMKDGNLTLVEVKVNTSRYRISQREKDESIARDGGYVNPHSDMSKQVFGVGLGYINPAPTKVVRVARQCLGLICKR